MYRVRWFIVNWNNCYSRVIDGILSDIYDEDKNYGFKSYKKREKILEGAYIKRKEIEEKIENPFTNESVSYQKIIYETTKFNLEDTKLGIELINPSRGIQELLNTFSALSKFNLTIKELNLDLSKLSKSLEVEFQEFIIYEIECKNIIIGNRTVGKLIAKNKRLDVFSDIENFLLNKDYLIEKIKCTFSHKKLSSTFELTNKGTLKTHNNNLEILLPIVKKNILKSIID